MKQLAFLLVVLSNMTFGQTDTMSATDIEAYAKSMDRLKAENNLVEVFYPNMSRCGGAVRGYYLNKELVVIDAQYGFELGYASRTIYLKQAKFLKISYHEHYAEWDKYVEKYAHVDFEFDPEKMTYTDTIWTVIFSDPVVFQKKTSDVVISNELDQSLVDELRRCGEEMKAELQTVIQQMDKLKEIHEMPYICEMELCGDGIYWDAVRMGRGNIELLMDKLDDSTATPAPVVLFGGTYTVADIAYDALSEIIHNIPTFELLGVPFDQEGCGYCAYWQHLNKDFSNRKRFKEAVKNWYQANKEHLVWVESNTFSTCDCSGEHPNKGHYELKKIE